MGRHKDPDTLAFIEYLRKKGEQSGFVTETEYKLYKDEYFIDMVWKLQKDQGPLFTFEVETRDNSGVFSNTAKIFGTSSNIVIKPWRHFMIIYKTVLSQGHKDSLHNILSQHNIMLFQNVFNDKKQREMLDKALQDCTYDISKLIEIQISSKPLGEALPAVLKGLTMGLNSGLIKDPEISVTVKSRAPEGGIKFSLLMETPAGQPTFLDRLKESEKTLKPFTIESPQLKEFTMEGKSVLPTKPTNAKVTITPTPPLLRARIIVPKTDVVFDEVVLRRIKTEGTTTRISTEDRNLPFVFTFDLDKEKNGGKFDFRFEPAKADVKQAFKFEEFIRALNSHKELSLVEKEKNTPLVGMRVHESYQQSEQWYDILSKLAYIQEKTNHPIPCPSKVTRRDLEDIYVVIRVINTGEDHGIIKDFSVKVDKKGARYFVDILKKEGKIPNLLISQGSTYAVVCGESIPLGRSKIRLPDMQFELSVEKMQELIEKAPDESPIKVALKPLADDRTTIEFENWLPKTGP